MRPGHNRADPCHPAESVRSRFVQTGEQFDDGVFPDRFLLPARISLAWRELETEPLSTSRPFGYAKDTCELESLANCRGNPDRSPASTNHRSPGRNPTNHPQTALDPQSSKMSKKPTEWLELAPAIAPQERQHTDGRTPGDRLID